MKKNPGIFVKNDLMSALRRVINYCKQISQPEPRLTRVRSFLPFLISTGEGVAVILWDSEGVQPSEGQCHVYVQGLCFLRVCED